MDPLSTAMMLMVAGSAVVGLAQTCRVAERVAEEDEMVIARRYFPDLDLHVHYETEIDPEHIGTYNTWTRIIKLYPDRDRYTLLHEAAHQYLCENYFKDMGETFSNYMEYLYILKQPGVYEVDGKTQSDVLDMIAYVRMYKPDYIW